MATSRYASLTARGSGSGADFANAMDYASIGAAVGGWADGDVLYLEAGLRYPEPPLSINWTKRVDLIGRNLDGTDGYAIIEGTRTDPWPANGIWPDNFPGTLTLAITFTASSDLATFAKAHNLAVGEQVVFTAVSGAAPLSTGTVYFVDSVPTSTTATLSATSGGARIDITANGTATGTIVALRSTITDATMTGPVTVGGDVSAWPTGSFYLDVETEILACSGRSGQTVTISGRGLNGTTAAAHAIGVPLTAHRYISASTGMDIFLYKDGAGAGGGCMFKNLGFVNVGTPIKPSFSSSAVTGDIHLQKIRTYKTNGLVYATGSANGQCNIHFEDDIRCYRYSEGVGRTWADIIASNLVADAKNTYHNPSTALTGLHVQGAIAGVTSRNYQLQANHVVLLNHAAVAPPGSSNDPNPATNPTHSAGGILPAGDCIVTEENTVLLPSANIYLAGAADHGWDARHAIAEGLLSAVYAQNNGFDISVLYDTLAAWISNSLLRSTKRPSYDTSKSAPIQGYGLIHAKHCYIEQINNDPKYAGVFYGQVKGSHVSGGVTIPQSVGHADLIECVVRYTASLSKTILTPGGSPTATPIYSEDAYTAAHISLI